MSAPAVDRVLAGLVVAMAATGLLTLRAGEPASGWLFGLHGLLAGALAAAVVAKLRASVPRAVAAGRWRRLALGLAMTLLAAAALSGGYLWVAAGEMLTLGGWTVLTLHAWAGLCLVPLVVVHLLPHRWRILRPRRRLARGTRPQGITRRGLLAAGGLGLAGLGAYAAAAIAERVAGGTRRFSGSRFLSPGGIPPATTFFGEAAPAIDPATWRLTVSGRVARTLTLPMDALVALGERSQRATLDCTSGWAIETDWRGVPLDAVVASAGPSADRRDVVVRSATGWSAVVPASEAHRCLLATDVAGGPLPAANGAPLRLVVPGRRGLDWVKWVTAIEVY